MKTREINRVRLYLNNIAKEETESFIKKRFPSIRHPISRNKKYGRINLESKKKNFQKTTAEFPCVEIDTALLKTIIQKRSQKSHFRSKYFDNKKIIISNGKSINKIPKIDYEEDLNNNEKLKKNKSHKESTKKLLLTTEENDIFKSTMNIHELVPNLVKKGLIQNSSESSEGYDVNDSFDCSENRFNQNLAKMQSKDLHSKNTSYEVESEEEIILDADNLHGYVESLFNEHCIEISNSSLPIVSKRNRQEYSQKRQKSTFLEKERYETDLNVICIPIKKTNKESRALFQNRFNNLSTHTTVGGCEEPNYNIDNVTEFNSNISIVNSNADKLRMGESKEEVKQTERSNLKSILKGLDFKNVVDYSHEFGFTFKETKPDPTEEVFKAKKGNQNYIREEKYNTDDKETNSSKPSNDAIVICDEGEEFRLDNRNSLKEINEELLFSPVCLENLINKFSKHKKYKKIGKNGIETKLPNHSCLNVEYFQSNLEKGLMAIMDNVVDFDLQVSKSNQNSGIKLKNIFNSMSTIINDNSISVYTV